MPWNSTAEEIEMHEPDGVFISNGPGDPEDVKECYGAILKELRGKYVSYWSVYASDISL